MSGVDMVVPARTTSGVLADASPVPSAAQLTTALTSANSTGVKPPTTKMTMTGRSLGLADEDKSACPKGAGGGGTRQLDHHAPQATTGGHTA